MNTVLTYLTILLTGVIMQAQNTIEVSMNNFKNDNGTVKIGLYNSEGDFLEKGYKFDSATISGKMASAVFSDIPDGTYAISCYHDENDNNKFDMYMGFFPKEPYACSNGATGMFGPPKWSDAKFEVSNGEVKNVEVKF